MAVNGGSIDTVNIAGRNFAAAADNEAQIKLGGFTNENQANGNGTARIVKTRGLAGIEGLQLEVDDARNDHQFLQDVADLNDHVTVSITLVDGTVYDGDQIIEGDFSRSTQSSLATINLMGPALRKQGV